MQAKILIEEQEVLDLVKKRIQDANPSLKIVSVKFKTQYVFDDSDIIEGVEIVFEVD